jgi:hypothetical protein
MWGTFVAVMVGWGGGMLSGFVRWEHLRSRGVNTIGIVEETNTVNGGDNPDSYYLRVSLDGCDCNLVVRVTTLVDHPVSSKMPVRYDPQDHSNAVALVDRPADWLWLGITCYIATLITAAVLAATRLRAYRRRKSFLHTCAERTSVKFRVWGRTFGNSAIRYLVVYDAATSGWDEPICCVPVLSYRLRKLRADDQLILYGNGEHDGAVLRREQTIIVPSGPVMPGRWEQSLRSE